MDGGGFERSLSLSELALNGRHCERARGPMRPRLARAKDMAGVSRVKMKDWLGASGLSVGIRHVIGMDISKLI